MLYSHKFLSSHFPHSPDEPVEGLETEEAVYCLVCNGPKVSFLSSVKLFGKLATSSKINLPLVLNTLSSQTSCLGPVVVEMKVVNKKISSATKVCSKFKPK